MTINVLFSISFNNTSLFLNLLDNIKINKTMKNGKNINITNRCQVSLDTFPFLILRFYNMYVNYI